MIRKFRKNMAAALTNLALRHLGPKRPYAGQIEDAVRRDWKTSTSRLGLSRHVPWHDRFRRAWIKLRRS